MLVRMWIARFDESKKERLLRYAIEVSLPILRSRRGCLGVLFFTLGDQWITQTIWRDQASIDSLATDAEYQGIVDGILALNVLVEDQVTAIYQLEGGTAEPG